MTTASIVENIFTLPFVLIFVKAGTLFAEFVYLVYAFLVVRQVGLMNRSFATKLGFLLSLASYIHFFAILGLLLLSLIIL